jgi:hypothetical protein
VDCMVHTAQRARNLNTLTRSFQLAD